MSSSNPFQTMGDCLSFVLAFRDGHEISLDQTSFVLMQQFFDSVRQSLAMMDPDEDVMLEFVCCELYSGLPKLIAGDFGNRPESFPTKYLRMWLSNTPCVDALLVCSRIIANALFLGIIRAQF